MTIRQYILFYLVKVGKDDGKSISKLRLDNFPYYQRDSTSKFEHVNPSDAGNVYFGVAVNGLIQGVR